MKKLSSSQIRQMWLDFFKSKGHHIEQGASLIPKNDPTLLWINAGVAALKKYFDGSEVPPCRRITNAQKCIRTNDIENVGKTARHHTFFEMLGNFSIGDYFRNEVIPWAYELLTSEQWFGIDKNNLYMTYFPDDYETKELWKKCGVEESHLICQPGNFWEIGEGPCGPDTEIFFDRGEKYDPKKIGIDLLKNDIENDRYIEIWNIVFSQFNSEIGKKRSEYKELPSKNIDTGAGLERFCCVLQGTDSNFETDLFWPVIERLEKETGVKYSEKTMAFRVIADHIRSITFALSDGEMFSNEGRGYVLRRLLRRAERFGKVLGLNKPFLFEYVDLVVEIMDSYYPNLKTRSEFIKKIILAEEEKFLKTLSNGEMMLQKSISSSKTLKAEDMFKLYDTFGFPKELTMEICEENGVSVDLDGFNKLMNEQKERARKARGELQSMNKQSADLIAFADKSEFLYNCNTLQSKVIALFKDGVKVDSITDEGDIILDKTNFYAESGGQVCDTGSLISDKTSANVISVIKAPNKQHLLHVKVLFGEICLNDVFDSQIDALRRAKIARNHSSVHLLQRALTDVLGDHIAQQGSYVNDEYSHFDFNHFQKMTPEQINEVERKVNEWISKGIKCETKVLPIEEAKKIGARALFDDKYGDTVRVVCFDDVSKEFCGGTHVENTSDIGVFVIEYEESVAAGIRRIQARTSSEAYEILKQRENVLNRCKNMLGVGSLAEVPNKIKSLEEALSGYKNELESLRSKLIFENSKQLVQEFVTINDFNLLVKKIPGNRDALVSMIDNLKQNVKNYVIVLLGDGEGSYPIVIATSNEVVSKGIDANKIMRAVCELLDGRGGGRNDIASGAIKNPSKLKEAEETIKGLLHE